MQERIENKLSSTRRIWVFEDPNDCPISVLSLLKKEFSNSEIPEELWLDKFKLGGLFVNGVRCFGDVELKTPCKIEFYDPKYSAKDAAQNFPAFKKEMIVFEDEDILCAYKPAGLPAHPNREQVYYNLKTYLQDYTGTPVHIPSRLDFSTQGLTLASKTMRMHNHIQNLFSKRQISKFYRLLVPGKPVWSEKTINFPIARDPEHAVLRKLCHETGKIALTKFSNLKSFNYPELDGNPICSLIEAKPFTGRTHQIRVHIKQAGFIIIGDEFYAGVNHPDLHLVSFAMKFVHPLTKTEVEITAPKSLAPSWCF